MTALDAELHELETTTSAIRRNELALKLADAKTADLPAVLVRLIARQDLTNERGTLVYCLGLYDCSPYVEMLVDLVVSGNWEAAQAAFSILEDLDEVSGDAGHRAFTAIATALAQERDDWRRELLQDLLALFE